MTVLVILLLWYKNLWLDGDNMSVYCKSKEGKEIMDALMSYITLETLSDDKCIYDIQEDGNFLNKEYSIFLEVVVNMECIFILVMILN